MGYASLDGLLYNQKNTRDRYDTFMVWKRWEALGTGATTSDSSYNQNKIADRGPIICPTVEYGSDEIFRTGLERAESLFHRWAHIYIYSKETNLNIFRMLQKISCIELWIHLLTVLYL